MEEKKRKFVNFEPHPAIKDAMDKEGERLELNTPLVWQLAALVFLRSRNKFSNKLSKIFKPFFK